MRCRPWPPEALTGTVSAAASLQPERRTHSSHSRAQNGAAQMIGQILTTPRPGGMPVSNMPGGVIGGGIAGVASNAESESIMVYNDRSGL